MIRTPDQQHAAAALIEAKRHVGRAMGLIGLPDGEDRELRFDQTQRRARHEQETLVVSGRDGVQHRHVDRAALFRRHHDLVGPLERGNVAEA